MVDGSEQITTDPEQIQYDAMHRQEALGVCDGGKLPHLSLALASRLLVGEPAIGTSAWRRIGSRFGEAQDPRYTWRDTRNAATATVTPANASAA